MLLGPKTPSPSALQKKRSRTDFTSPLDSSPTTTTKPLSKRRTRFQVQMEARAKAAEFCGESNDDDTLSEEKESEQNEEDEDV